jgi:hypothetical protein
MWLQQRLPLLLLVRLLLPAAIGQQQLKLQQGQHQGDKLLPRLPPWPMQLLLLCLQQQQIRLLQGGAVGQHVLLPCI